MEPDIYHWHWQRYNYDLLISYLYTFRYGITHDVMASDYIALDSLVKICQRLYFLNVSDSSDPLMFFFFSSTGPGLLHQKQHRHRKPDKRNKIHCQFTHREILLQRVRRGGPFYYCWSTGEPHLQHRRWILFIFTFLFDAVWPFILFKGNWVWGYFVYMHEK